jgi:predicted ATPase
MKETITIKNFGGLKDVTIPLNSINIFIGKQASGKSVTAKLIYFFRMLVEDIFDGVSESKNQKEIEEEIIKRFKKYFPVTSWSRGKFFIQYESGNEHKSNKTTPKFEFGTIKIERQGKEDIKIIFSHSIKEQLSKLQKAIEKTLQNEEIKRLLPEISNFKSEGIIKFFYHMYLGDKIKPFGLQIFVPAGRSFFSNIQSSIYSFLAEERPLDPFLIEFGAVYSAYKNIEVNGKPNKRQKYIQDSLLEITDGEFISDKTGDYIVHQDGRKINLLFCSSGQQEVLPLGLILKTSLEQLILLS